MSGELSVDEVKRMPFDMLEHKLSS